MLAVPLIIQAELAHAQLTWDGEAGTDEWSLSTNWSPDSSPTGAINFSDAGTASSSAAATNIVDESFTISSLIYNQNTTSPPAPSTSRTWHVTEILEDAELTVQGNFTVGGAIISSAIGTPAAPVTTNTAIRGAGTLTIESPAGSIFVGNRRTVGGVGSPSATLDLRGLKQFNTNVSSVLISSGANSVGTMYLGNSNTVTADSIAIGDSGGNSGATGTLALGTNNTLNVNSIYVGAASGSGFNYGTGTVQFDSGVAAGTGSVVIRGQAGGTSRTNLYVGALRLSGTQQNIGGSPVGTVDFGSHSVDALLDQLILGSGGNGLANSSTTGTLTMGAGSMDVTTAIVGQTGFQGDLDANPAVGNLNINGGTFAAESLYVAWNRSHSQAVTGNVNISGGDVTVNTLTMGQKEGSVASNVIANLTVSGGSLTANSNILEGSSIGGSDIVSTVTLSGGTLNMSGNALVVDTFNAERGTLDSLAQFNFGEDLVKTTSGTLTITGINTYTGQTIVAGGVLIVDGTVSSPSVTVQDGARLGGSGVITGTINVQSGGALAPGNSPGTLQIGNLEMASASTFSAELDGATPGSGYDQVVTTGDVDLNSDLGVGANLELTLIYAPAMGQVFTLIANDGADPILGEFATINGESFGPGNTFTLIFESTEYEFALHYDGEGNNISGGNDLVAQLVPEPSAGMMLAGGMFAYSLLRRKRCKLV